MITEPTIPIEPKGIDRHEVINRLHILMLAEPGWVIPAGRYERRYAAYQVSDRKRGDKAYFSALRDQIYNGGAEAMMWDLERMELGDWHPREILDSLLRSAALQKQQRQTMPPLEQWYFMLLHEGRLPGAKVKDYPTACSTRSLIADAMKRVPRLRTGLSDMELRNFLLDEERIGTKCQKHHATHFNGWRFPPLTECREAWDRLYGAAPWDTDLEEWQKPETL